MFREANYGTKPCSWIKYILLYHRAQQLHGLNEFFENIINKYIENVYKYSVHRFEESLRIE